MIRKFFTDESGAAAVEYCLLAAFIALVIIGAVDSLGNAVQGNFTDTTDTLH